MIDPLVRPAHIDDTDQLRELEAEAREHLIDQRGGARWLGDHRQRGADWHDPIAAGGVWVAHIDAMLTGYIVVSIDGVAATVDDVYVTPPARELGFGDELLAAAIASVRAMGAQVLDGQALPGDRNTKNLYERAGIKARLITVSTPL